MSKIQDQTPSGLPTLAEVKRFTEHWRERIQAIDATANASFQIFQSGLGTRFYGYSNGASTDDTTPEQMLLSLEGLAGPGAKLAKIAKLKAELAALEEVAA